MSDLESPYGYALRRNGSCYDTENDCGQTWAPYHACCPKGTVCTHNSSDNCCRSEADCGNILAEDPHCGNTTGVLYLENNYFCCADGTAAFAWIDKGWVGCADSVSLLGSQYSLLSPVSTTQSTSTTTNTSTTSASTVTSQSKAATIPATATAEPTDLSDSSSTGSSSSTNTGAIAGGVVGGVAGLALVALLIWYFVRRSQAARTARPQAMSYVGPRVKNYQPTELQAEASPPIYELALNTPTARNDI
ncbi:similar to An11g07840 [Aspergillus luchuensis]|uniref:Similar to An11g07840 n=1 Tax=Aspergillus kawachii TaxID=1069201 RepID=A0A146FD32_ASPKA|nr:similar to An11g07840 [Aspergillus luchuensis]